MPETTKPTFYVTTPIYYVNDIPHVGHAYTTIIADALARFNRLRGREVFFLTGTDEHGQKIERAAAERGVRPVELADKVVGRFKELWQALGISYDGFIRTTDPRHEKGVQKIFQALKEKGDIYKGTYQGWYCVSDENFLADDVPLQPEGDKICPDCGKRAVLVSEDTYFFRLSRYQQPLLDFYAGNPDFVRPAARLNEVVSFVRQGLRDLSITRTTVKWGIPVPDDPGHTIYVWFDALHNYVTAVGYGWDPERFARFWPATIHLIGKDILRFHAVFWPAFLMASGFDLPKTVYGHGWWLKDEAKMSKSRGNVLDPYQILKTFGADPLRYFLLREIPIGLDGNFSHEGFIHRVNSDLANDLGNLVHRALTMIQGYFNGTIEVGEAETEADRHVRQTFDALKTKVAELFDHYALNKALEEIWAYVNDVNKYLASNEPWKLAQDETRRPRLARILYQAAAAIRGIAYLVYPVMPESGEKVWRFLGEPKSIKGVSFAEFEFDGLRPAQKIEKHQPLFPRVVLEDFLEEEAPAAVKVGAATPTSGAASPGTGTSKGAAKKEDKVDIISFDEFKKMDLRVGEILKAERVPNTDKLLKIEINLGAETRTMVAGVANTYAPEEMVGKKLIVICNLKPAVIRGIESQAMLLAAEIDGKAIIPFFDRDVPAGAKVK
jgi:methionyl-tRNA synthetase